VTVVIALAVVVSLVAISGRTLWIDEALTAVKAQAPTLNTWWGEMVQERASDMQMPLYMIYVWSWEKVFGSTEWALRMANLPWFVLGVAVFAWGHGRVRSRLVFILVPVLLSPFAWYYLDEARPYAMQLGASLIVIGALCRLHYWSPSRDCVTPSEKDTRMAMCWYLAGLVVLSGSSMLGMVWAGAATLALLWVAPGVWHRMLLRSRVASSAAVMMLAGLGVYYLWTLSAGARASAGATTTAQSTIFIAYELFGFMGLGPGRLDLRAGGASTLKPYLPWLVIYAAALGTLFLCGAREWLRNPEPGEGSARWTRRKWLLAGIIVAPAIFLLAVGVTANFRVLGRHFTPLYPVVAMLLAAGAAALWSRPGLIGKSATTLFLGLSLISCGSLRLADRHAKDDYREAAGAAREALGKGATVWWNAAGQGARYYGVRIGVDPGTPGAAWLCVNPEIEDFAGAGEPNLIITSRQDVYDNTGMLARYIAENGYAPVRKLPAFVVWTKRGSDPGRD
jgi:hypothetical protein